MGFAAIIGHVPQLDGLRLALRSDRLHHAYLFIGPDGVGKRTVALALAKALHCREAEGDFCGRCAECARIQGHNHPDVKLIECGAEKKEISIQQVRELEKALRFRSFSGGRKIAIIDPATLLNQPAQNALLKTLEEPPTESLLILLATSTGSLLPTLRSRCLRLNFGPLSREAVARFLVERKRIDATEAALLAALGMGSIGTALDIDGEELRRRRRLWGGMLSALEPENYRGAIEAAEALAASREETLQFLSWVQTWYHDRLVQTVHGETEDCINIDMIGELRVRLAPPQRILSDAARATDAATKIQRNLNRRMVLEQFLFGVVGSE
jgi:DNA polymerase III subunit delta'